MKDMLAFHATRNLKEIYECGEVKPARMSRVYLFFSKKSAIKYAREFKYDAVVSVKYNRKHRKSIWYPAYSKPEAALSLVVGATADYVETVWVS